MKARIVSTRVLMIAAVLVLVLTASAPLLSAEVHKSTASGFGSVQPPTPFRIFSSCPPATCVGQWDGTTDGAAGNSDFAPAGIPVQFSFTTGSAVNWYCDYQNEYCHADYSSGTFTATGPAGTFTGQITSGYASEAPLGWEIFVTFSGQWSNGQRMTGSANERYVEEFQIPDTTLTFTPMH